MITSSASYFYVVPRQSIKILQWKRSGSADLPLHCGYVPKWLTDHMAKPGQAIKEVIISGYGKEKVLRRCKKKTIHGNMAVDQFLAMPTSR